jgi:medium-chain acyl-[acyl-carrier-protein] hydrolase
MEKYIKEYNIRTYECDKNGYLRIVTLFNILQDIADSHATDLGLGMEYCLSKGFAWVGANYHIKINRMPQTHEDIKIITWPSEERKIGAIRDFSIYDSNDNLIITATSQWILIDFARKRPVSLKDNLPEYTVINEHSLVSNFDKIKSPERIDIRKTYSVRYDDIDINMHVNNALYPLWASETLDNSFRDENLPSEIEISFKKEGYLGDDIEVISEVSEGKTIHSIKAINDNRELSSVRINWIKR